MKIKMFLVSLFTFIIPVLTPFGYWVMSYADPFLIGRDLLIDSLGARNLLVRAFRLLIICIACLILFFVLQKSRLAIISAVCSFISETLDFFFTMKFQSLKVRPVITVACNVFDTFLFMLLVVLFDGISELDYNIFIDTIIMAVIYFILFFFTRKTKLFKNYA